MSEQQLEKLLEMLLHQLLEMLLCESAVRAGEARLLFNRGDNPCLFSSVTCRIKNQFIRITLQVVGLLELEIAGWEVSASYNTSMLLGLIEGFRRSALGGEHSWSLGIFGLMFLGTDGVVIYWMMQRIS